ncbi:nuclear respiratory factor 1-like [Pipistrellus kuhlii]|uniref:nuclear respiratory factor 1-like n=1 Tax=Pipistrellus kuhlii TaxID=59472 RepID=UPI001E273E7D|nr:nuclear respiratory factor 1-like [Pipistrellus kuhlii]
MAPTHAHAHTEAAQAQRVPAATYTDPRMLNADEDSPSSPEDISYDDSEIFNAAAADEVTAHLAAAGPAGMAAAAAVATGRRRKGPHVFEPNPSIRKRQRTRMLRKLRATLEEYTTRVGQQAVVLCVSPSQPSPVFKVFGAAPLERVVRRYQSAILGDLECALAQRAPGPPEGTLELPPLTVDGIPVSVDKMTQAQLRAFIPEMLKSSTGRGKPGWGKESCKPVWWPEDIPWASVRRDVRTEEQKQRVGTGATVATLADASELPATVTVAQMNDAAAADGEVGQNWATLQGGEMAIRATQASEATQAAAPLAAAAAAASQEMQQGATVTMAHNSEATAHAIAASAEPTLRRGGHIVLSVETAAAVAGLTGAQNTNGLVQIPESMYQTLVTSLTQGNWPVQVVMAPGTAVSMDGQAVEVMTLEQ